MQKFSLFALIFGCCCTALHAQTKEHAFSVFINISAKINDLHPLIASGANSAYLKANLFGGLLEYEPATGNLRPLLATARPTIETVADGPYAGKWKISYEIRPEAAWDNSTAITAADYLFSLKIICNPALPLLAGARNGLSFIDSVALDPQNPRRFSIFCNRNYFLAENATGLMYILPAHIYDPDQRLQAFSLSQLRAADPAHPSLQAFADNFYQDRYKSDPRYISGFGAYRVREFVPEKRIILERKANWWGDKVKDAPALQIGPDELVYLRMDSEVEAVRALKDGKLDVMRINRPTIFVDLLNNPALRDRFNIVTANNYAYYHVGYNLERPQLADKRVRLALAHLFNRDQFISDIFQGMARPITTPVSLHKSFAHPKLKPIAFDPNKARKLLADAGWKDSDGNGILDKTIDGKQQEMRLQFYYNEGNYVRQNVGLLLQADAQKAGIDIQVNAVRWDSLLTRLDQGQFDLYCIATIQEPGWDDFWNTWHSSAIYPHGSNRGRFRNEASDKLLETIQHTLDEKQLKKLYLDWQELIYEEQPQLFLFAPPQLMVISKRFSHNEPTVVAPNFAERFFQLK